MIRIDPKQLDDIFRAAIELPHSERGTYLKSQCGDDPQLLERVQKLLQASASPDDAIRNILAEPRNSVLDSLAGPHTAEDLSDVRIGHWRIDEPLARGGLAMVYIAHRDDGQYQQKVALKVLRRGLDTDDIVSRFLAERQILSSLDHPAIAKILDGGVMDDGRPYFVLEFVDGSSITRYCDEYGVSVRDRIGLVIDVLRALQHAHNHLVVHRDIKPSNIMVSNAGHVALLDFGIAKLLDPTALPGTPALTRTGAVLLTPEYGSPEQHTGKAVTTASDIYQVGGVLYELLAGSRPPSGRNVTEHMSSVLPGRMQRQSGSLGKIDKDLYEILSKAMQVDPALRYESAGAMIDDLNRYLDGRPVLARPGSLGYRSYKLLRRRPLLLPATLLLIASSIGYMITLNSHNREITIERQRALAAQAFLVDLLGSANPFGTTERDRGKAVLVVDALDIGLERLRTGDYGGDDKLRAALMTSIADAYAGLDKTHESIQVRLEALELERALYGDASLQVIWTLRELGHYYRTVGDYQTARRYYEDQLSNARLVFGPNDPRLGLAEMASGMYLYRAGEIDAGRALIEASVVKLEREPLQYTDELVNATVSLARAREGDEQEDTRKRLLDMMELADEVYGPDAPLSGLARTQYATSLMIAGEYEESERYFASAISIYEAKLGRDHGSTLIALSNLGRLYFRMGLYDNAELVQRETLGHYHRQFGPEHRGVAENSNELAHTLAAQGHLAEAIPHFQQAYESFLAVMGANRVNTYAPLVSMAEAQMQLGHFADAEALASRAATGLAMADSDSRLLPQAHCLSAQARVRMTSVPPQAFEPAACRTAIE